MSKVKTFKDYKEMMNDESPYMWICCLCLSMGIKNTHLLDKPVEVKIDDTWSFKLNGKTEKVDGIPPLNALVIYNGFPAAVFGLEGGIFVDGSEGNTTNFRKAIIEKLKSL